MHCWGLVLYWRIGIVHDRYDESVPGKTGSTKKLKEFLWLFVPVENHYSGLGLVVPGGKYFQHIFFHTFVTRTRVDATMGNDFNFSAKSAFLQSTALIVALTHIWTKRSSDRLEIRTMHNILQGFIAGIVVD